MAFLEYDAPIRAWIEAHKEEILSEHMALCRIPSVRGEAEENAPYGKACDEALTHAAALFEKEGCSVRIEHTRGYALASFGEGEKTIGIYGHSDVVPVGDGWIKTDPFEPRVIDGVLYGRGVGDNKAGVIQSFYALKAIRELALPVKNRLQVFIGANEESGMGDMQSFVKNEAMPEINLVPDSSYPCSVGEKGILRIWTKSKTPLTEILDICGGNAPNIVLDHVSVTLPAKKELKAELSELIRDDSAFELSEKEGVLLLIVHGASKHAAHPEDSVNAALLAFALLSKVSALPEGDRRQMAIAASAISSYYGEGLGIAHEDEDFGKLTSVCGMVRVEDGRLMINMDIRYGVSFAPEKLEERLFSAWEKLGYTVEEYNNRPGFRISKDSPIPALLCKSFKELTGMEKEPALLSGGTYSRCLKNSFTIGFRCIDPDSTVELPPLPAGHGHAHQRDEAIILDQFYQSLRLLIHYILVLDAELSK